MRDDFTADEKRQCIGRELGLRRQLYPGWVEAKKLTQAEADREIALMEAIYADYRKAARADQPDLFEEQR